MKQITSWTLYLTSWHCNVLDCTLHTCLGKVWMSNCEIVAMLWKAIRKILSDIVHYPKAEVKERVTSYALTVLYLWETGIWHFKNFVNQKFEQKIYWFKCLLLPRVKLSFAGWEFHKTIFHNLCLLFGI